MFLPATTIFINVSNAPIPNPQKALATINMIMLCDAEHKTVPIWYMHMAKSISIRRRPNTLAQTPYKGCTVALVNKKA
jgi:hypothetical protein